MHELQQLETYAQANFAPTSVPQTGRQMHEGRNAIVHSGRWPYLKAREQGGNIYYDIRHSLIRHSLCDNIMTTLATQTVRKVKQAKDVRHKARSTD